MQSRLSLRGACAAASSLLALAAGSAMGQATSVPVTFGTPDHLDLGAPPLESSSAFPLLWDFDNSGAVTSNVSVVCTPGFTGPDDSAKIVPSLTGHAINTKGTGFANGRLGITLASNTETLTVKIGRIEFKTRSASHPTIELEVGVGAHNGLDNTLLLMDIDIFSPNGLEFMDFLVTSHDSDGDGLDDSIDLESIFFPGGASDPLLPDVTYQFSARAVPTPGAAATLGLAGLIAVRRRRR